MKTIMFVAVVLAAAPALADTYTNGPNGYSSWTHQDSSGIIGHDNQGHTWSGFSDGSNDYINVNPSYNDRRRNDDDE